MLKETSISPGTGVDRIDSRIRSIDILRGLVMVIMALDHVREFWGPTPFRPEDLSQTNVLLFATRWITHLCAPTFIFLSGISIFLYEQKMHSRAKTSIFLLTRGLWLVLVEIGVMSFIIMQGYQITLLEVIWVIGCSMILMAALIWLPRWLMAVLVVLMAGFHNLLPAVNADSPLNVILAVFHSTPFFVQSPSILVTYTIIPWVAVMLGGYLTGSWYTLPPDRRISFLRTAAMSLLIAFVTLRLINVYGDPSPWMIQERGWMFTVLSFLNVTKYPPSLLFLCLTLGVALIFLLVYDRGPETRVKEWLSVFGRVPFFFFVVHFALISAGSYVWTWLAYGKGYNLSFASPAGYEANLGRVYVVWIAVVCVMYFPCRWFGNYRRRNKAWWLSYF